MNVIPAELTNLVDLYKSELLVCALVLARVSPVVLLAPAIGGRSVPLRLRFAFAICLSTLILPLQLAGSKSIVAGIEDFPRALFSEALIGSSIALALSLVVAGVQLGGQVVSSMSGFSLARLVNSGGGTTSAVGRLIELAAFAGFLTAGGHRKVVDALLDTFRWAPAGRLPITSDLIGSTIGFAGEIFVVALRIAVPIGVALLLSIVVVGLISRAVPQLNTMSVGLGLNAAVMLAMLSITFGSVVWIFGNEVNHAMETMRAAIAAVQD